MIHDVWLCNVYCCCSHCELFNCLYVCIYVCCHKSIVYKQQVIENREKDGGRPEIEMRNDNSEICNRSEREKTHIRNVGVSMK